MKYLPKNTLAHFNAAPATHQHDLSELPTAVFSEATVAFLKNCGMQSPQEHAVTFYVLNHCASIVRKSFTANEPLPEWAHTIMTTYTETCQSQGERLLHYLLYITVREMRHLKSSTHAAVPWKEMGKNFGEKATAFIKVVAGHSGDEAGAFKEYTHNPPDVSVGAYTKALSYAFYHGSWGGSFGGKMWGNITDALVSMLTGATSLEMLVDTGYTLEHNTTSIFNKAKMYSSPDHHLPTILDVQRSGQMLDLMVSSEALGVQKTSEAVAAVELIKTHCPAEIKGFVDWKMVDDLRPQVDKSKSPSKYVKVIAAQKQPKAPVAPKVATPAKLVTVAGKKAKVVGTWQVFPHQAVSVLERVGN